jgi:glucokinase
MKVLAGDVGGTNLRLAWVEVLPEEPARVLAARTVLVEEHPDLAPAAAAFLETLPERPRRACLGVAGTITGRVLEGVNLPWRIDADALEAELGLERLDLINDFHAAARGVEVLGEAGFRQLAGQAPDPQAPIAILGAGTGLGQAFLIPGEGTRLVVPTEGGHRDFAPTSPEQDRLLVYLRERFGRVSTERVLSGPGLSSIYSFLVEAEGREPCAAVEEAGRDPAAVSGSEHPTASSALDLFVDVYGAEAGNLGLTVLARGGVYLAGGIAPRIVHGARAERFVGAFVAKGRFADYMSELPLRLITEPDLGLLGAAREVQVGSS